MTAKRKVHRRVKKGKKKQEMTFTESLVSWIKTIVGAVIVVMIINGIAIASFVVPTPSMENTVMTGDFLFVNKFIYHPSTPQVVPFFNIPLPYISFPGLQKPERGDVIVFIFPGMKNQVKADEFQYYLKRCVGVAGDTIQVIDNILYVNGEKQKFPEHGKYDKSVPVRPDDRFRTFPNGKNFTRMNYGPIRIPKENDVIPLSTTNIFEWEVFIKREGHEVSTMGGKVLIDGKPVDNYVVERNYVFGMGDNRDHSLDSRYFGFIPEENVVGTPLIVYWSWDTNLPLASNFFKKFTTIRWNRLGTIIK